MKSDTPAKAKRPSGLYKNVILEVFNANYRPNLNRFSFTRAELAEAGRKFGLKDTDESEADNGAKNLGDIVYTFRFRRPFPKEINDKAPAGKMWIIVGKGDAVYEFRLISEPKIAVDPGKFITKVHDATPEIVRRFSSSLVSDDAKFKDEQAVLARIRYNRLVDMFCKCVAYSMQNHLRTKVKGIGQIEIDELYVGMNRQGEHFIIPVQVKGLRDKLGVSQLLQDLEYCRTFPAFTAKAIGAQMFRKEVDGSEYDVIALMEFEVQDLPEDVVIAKGTERHFLLLPASKIGETDFEAAKHRIDED